MNMRYGIDVSHHQGSIDWSRVKASNKVDFVIMKVMYESSKQPDETFAYNYAECTNYSLNRGVYNFIGAVSASDPVADANAFLKILNGRELEYGIWLDVESKNLRALGNEKVEEVILKETEIFENAGYFVGVYCNLNWYKNVITDKVKSIFAGRMWIARYQKKDDGTVAEHLNPRDLCKESIGWQYSSKGRVDGISTNVDLDMFWGEVKKEKPKDDMFVRERVVTQCNSYIGTAEYSDRHAEILSIYNNNKPLPGGYSVKPSDAWCATFVSAMFIKCGYANRFPIECSCRRMIEKAIKMGMWVENDGYIPNIGDVILYDWQDNGVSDNIGIPDHVGIVTYVNRTSGYIVVVEGNKSNAVGKRTININGRYIRGYVTPPFAHTGMNSEQTVLKDVDVIAHEVIAGMWGNGEYRKNKLTDAGYNYSDVQDRVNNILNVPKVVDTSNIVATAKARNMDKSIAGQYTAVCDVYCRDGAGKNKKALVVIPSGTKVMNYGYYSISDGVNWLYIKFKLDEVTYTGFTSSLFLRR